MFRHECTMIVTTTAVHIPCPTAENCEQKAIATALKLTETTDMKTSSTVMEIKLVRGQPAPSGGDPLDSWYDGGCESTAWTLVDRADAATGGGSDGRDDDAGAAGVGGDCDEEPGSCAEEATVSDAAGTSSNSSSSSSIS